MAAWAKDSLLTILFVFFVAGIELKHELITGELRDPRAAALPIVAAVCGMAVPAVFCLAVPAFGGGSQAGWAVPTATDTAFALAALSGIGFTVSLLIGELAFSGDPVLAVRVKAAVLIGSLIATVVAGALHPIAPGPLATGQTLPDAALRTLLGAVPAGGSGLRRFAVRGCGLRQLARPGYRPAGRGAESPQARAV